MTPVCKCHGEPQYWVKDTRYRAGGFWRCSVKHRAAHLTPEGQASRKRYEAKRIRSHVAGTWTTYRVSPERKAELQAHLAEFREAQSVNYRKARDGGFDQAVP